MQITLNIHRKDPDTNGEKPTFHAYEVDVEADATVLDALLQVRDEQDPTLSFRGACQSGYCGECAMHINGKGRFACLQSVQGAVKKDEVKVEPIRNIPVLKDLVYDMETFLFRKIKNLRPGVRSTAMPAGLHELDDAQLAPLRNAMTCHMCGMCDEGCTVIVVDKEFMGPAALTKAYRYVFDPRDTDTEARMAQVNGAKGIWDCTHCYEANSHCPLGIDPTDRIFDLRDLAFRRGITNNPRVERHHLSFIESVKETGHLNEGKIAMDTEGVTNIRGLLNLMPTAVRAFRRGKLPNPLTHKKRPGVEQIKRIFEKVEGKK
jgi:succinate dehydrogenase / fumarate reductase iron-sulfur subunit